MPGLTKLFVACPRLPIIDPSNGNVLYILNQKPLLRFLFDQVPHLDSFNHLSISIAEAGVGTFDNIEVGGREDQKITMMIICRLQVKTQQLLRL